MFDAAQLPCRIVSRDAGDLLRVLGVGGRLPAAVERRQQFGGRRAEFLTQIPELVCGVGHVQTLPGDHRLIGGAAPGDLFGLRLGGCHLRLQRTDARTRAADLGVERISLGLGEIELAGDVLVLVAQLVDGAVQRVDLGRAQRNPDVIGVRPHHRLIDEVDDAQVAGLRGVALLDLLDVAEDLALALCDGKKLAGVDQWVDLLERVG